MSTDTDLNKSLLTFPCDFLIKIVGAATAEFEIAVLAIMHEHCPLLREDAVKQRNSKEGKYLALSILVSVDSQNQLDDIYRALSASPLVVMAL